MKLSLVVCGLVTASTLSCGSSGSSVMGPELTTMGMLGEPTTALVAGNLIFVKASMNMMDENLGFLGC